MPKIFIAFLALTLFISACKNKEQKAKEVNDSSPVKNSLIKSEKPITKLNPASKEMVATWPEYQKFDELISQYQETSMNEALLNSIELSELARQLKDSVRIEKLDIPEVKIRLNVLYSETLRLADMSTIQTITEALVAQENNNVIDAYSALNIKINNMTAQDELNEEISTFVDEVLDEPKQDSLKIKDQDEEQD